MGVFTTAVGLGLDSGAARLVDYRFFGIERIDLKARYGARCDGSSYPLSGVYSSLASAQVAYPNTGLTAANWSAMELDTAAWLQAEYDLRTGNGGIIGLADKAVMRVSQQLWLQQAYKTWFHGGRTTSLVTESTGTAPAIRISQASAGDYGPAQTVPLRDLCLRAFNTGRAFFGSTAGVAYPGLANSAALASSAKGGYRTGASALMIDGGGSNLNSTHLTIEGVKWFNYDEPLRWGDETFCLRFADCFAESNNKGASWSQTAGLNSMENVTFTGGNYSNNNYGFYWNSAFTDSSNNPQSQGGSIFIRGVSIDYNVVSQGVFILASSANTYSNSSMHMSQCHVENNPACIGAGPWFTLQGRGCWTDNEIYINGVAPSGLISIGDNSSGTMTSNRIGGLPPLFVSSTANFKSVYGLGNELNPVGTAVVLLRDAAGSVLQQSPDSAAASVDYYQDNLLYTVAAFGNLKDVFLSSTCTKFTLPANGPDSFRPGHQVRIWNKSTAVVTMYVPEGVTLGGLRGYTQPAAGQGTLAGQQIPANSMVVLRRSDTSQWALMGAFAASAPS